MLVLCRFSVVALHILLVTHIAHTFVLLTANVEDVKKIARKFVSDELAEKIADFIARATETFAQQTSKTSDENTRDNSQVSAENRMYNIQRHGFVNFNRAVEKCKGENCKNNRKTTNERNKSRAGDTDTTDKTKKETKGRSRYIIESEPKDTKTKKAVSKASEKEKYDQMKEAINIVEGNLISANEKSKTKKQKKKSKVIPYKLLSNFDFDDDNDVEDESRHGSQEKKKEKIRHRTFDDEIVLVRSPALENDGKKAVKNDGNLNETTNENAAKSGSLVIENDEKEKWWEKELPKHNQDDDNVKKKSWF